MAGLKASTSVNRIQPVPKLTTSASTPLVVATANSPLIRDCSAVNAPTMNATLAATVAPWSSDRRPSPAPVTGSVEEVSGAGEIHRRSGRLRGRDDLVVTHGATGLYDDTNSGVE